MDHPIAYARLRRLSFSTHGDMQSTFLVQIVRRPDDKGVCEIRCFLLSWGINNRKARRACSWGGLRLMLKRHGTRTFVSGHVVLHASPES